MTGLRCVLVLLLAMLAELGAPMVPGTATDLDETQHAVHGRRTLLAARYHLPPRPAAAGVEPEKVRSRPSAPRRMGDAISVPRKTPAPPAPTSAPDH